MDYQKVKSLKKQDKPERIKRGYTLTVEQIEMLEDMYKKIHKKELTMPRKEQTHRDAIVGRAIEELYEREGKE